MSWKDTLQLNVDTVDELDEFIAMTAEDAVAFEAISEKFPISSTRYYLNLIDKSNPDDPIKKMCIPSANEFDLDGKFDTSGESQNTIMKGLQHKYSQTALLLSTNKCAMYCRHCFRKRIVGTSTQETLSFIKEAVSYIKTHPEINNVLITGGDSFLLSNHLIESYLKELIEIPHLDFIRFGTRTPVVFPERISTDPELLSILETYSKIKQIYVVTQFNHPREITIQAKEAIDLLSEHHIIVNNQTVLLKGVNDDPATLASLQNLLVKNGIVPYYIFQCRPVTGVKNQFQIPLEKAYEIVSNARKLMSGHARRTKFCMSHETGKIEIIGQSDSNMIFKYHQSKYPENHDRIFSVNLKPNQAWLEPENFK
jgi:KamA family protein